VCEKAWKNKEPATCPPPAFLHVGSIALRGRESCPGHSSSSVERGDTELSRRRHGLFDLWKLTRAECAYHQLDSIGPGIEIHSIRTSTLFV
jgi:hypothetical protein